MPKMVSPLAQGNSFGRSADGGQLADTATRTWKVILNEPNESWDIGASVGVQIGDPYSDSNPIPCVSVEARADGESRLVRIVTAQYRTQVGDGGGGEDPGSYSPDVRPANFSTSTTLYEVPAYKWKRYDVGFPDSDWKPVANVIGDPVDGVSKMDPITTIRITQFSATPGTIYQQHCGCINSEPMSLGGYLSCEPHTVLFRGVEAAPHVESFGNMVYRGFMNSYEFAYRRNFVGDVAYGWDRGEPVSGFNCKAFNPAQPGNDKDPYAQPLKYDDYVLVEPLALPDKVNAGDKVRAMVRITNQANGKVSQDRSAQPVPLNVDGTPRISSADPPVLVWRYQVQKDINLTQTLQLRLN
jgi:hypothetical protein